MSSSSRRWTRGREEDARRLMEHHIGAVQERALIKRAPGNERTVRSVLDSYAPQTRADETSRNTRDHPTPIDRQIHRHEGKGTMKHAWPACTTLAGALALVAFRCPQRH